MTLDDDTLVAYLDGQLPEAECARVEQALVSDAALGARLQALAESSELARRAFDPVLLEPVPPHLIASIWQAPDPRTRATPPKSPGPFQRWREIVQRATQPRVWPALASVAVLGLVVGLAWQWQAADDATGWALQRGDTVLDPTLARALDTLPSGDVLQTADGVVELLATFRQREGGHCREFNRSSTDSTRDELGIACRTGAGQAWQLAFVAAETRNATDRTEYQTASDAQHDAADAFLHQRVQGGPLEADEETALIARGWTAGN